MNVRITELAVAETEVETAAGEMVQLSLTTLDLVGGGQAITSFYHSGPRLVIHVFN